MNIHHDGHHHPAIADPLLMQELAAIIKSDKIPRKDYLVVDVRDDDWAGGNIKNSYNSPSNKFLVDVDNLVADSQDIPTMVFHCAYSQTR